MEPFAYRGRDGEPGVYCLERWGTRFPFVTAGISSRVGGVSEPPYDSLNCALHVADDPDRGIANRKRLAASLGVPFESWTCAEQVHGCRVAVVTSADRGKGSVAREDAIPDTDGLITRQPGIWLTAFFADCVPLYFFDPVRRAVGLAHAGWKGTALKIAERTVESMRQSFGTDPADLLAAIGPSIGACCYEVDEPVIDRIRATLDDIGETDADAVIRSTNDGKYRLNLQEMNRRIMIKAGILPIHIEVSTICTGCRRDRLFSHRKEGGTTGRMVAWIGMGLKASR